MTLSDEISTRGYWNISIHPATFQVERIGYQVLLQVLRGARVQLTGWDFPHIGHDNELISGKDFIGFDTDWFYYREVVRFWQSGQFVYRVGIREDWYERGSPTMWRPPNLKPGVLLGLADVVTTYTEIFEFAARLASQPDDDKWIIGVTLMGLKGRQLYAENPRRALSTSYVSQIDEWAWEESFTQGQLLADASELAVAKARELLLRFRADMSLDVLRDIQKDTRRVS